MQPFCFALGQRLTHVTFLQGTSEHLPHTDLEQICRYRHRVFVEELGWSLESQRGIDRDQFDRLDTWHVGAVDTATRRIVGVARLLPTHRPYLLASVFPQLVADPPRDRGVWELSRFAATGMANGVARSQFASPFAVLLLQRVLSIAAAHQVHRLITVSPVGVLRLLEASGFAAERAGPPAIVEGDRVEALWIDVPADIQDQPAEPPDFIRRPFSA